MVKDLKNKYKSEKFSAEDLNNMKYIKTKELLKIVEYSEREDTICSMLESGEYTIDDVDINEILDSKICNSKYNTDSILESCNHYAIDILKSILKSINTKNITKKSLGKLFNLEGDDSEYIDILKKIVESTDVHKDMFFFDYEDNGYNNEKSIKMISEKLNIPKGNLYPAYKSSMFKTNVFNPIFLTNLTGFYDKEDYGSAEYTVIFY